MHNRLRRVFGERETERARNISPQISPVRAMLIIRLDSSKFKKGHKLSGNPTPSKNTYVDGGKSEFKKGNDRNAQHDREPCGKCGRLHGGECLVGTNAFYGCGKSGHMIRDWPHFKNHAKADTYPQPNNTGAVEPFKEE